MKISIQPPNEPEPHTTGYTLRQRRNELGLSANNVSKLSGVSKSFITKAERNLFYLKKDYLYRICNILQIEPTNVIDLEYQLFYQGYSGVVATLVNELGYERVTDFLGVTKRTVDNWVMNKLTPSFFHRRSLAKLFSQIMKSN